MRKSPYKIIPYPKSRQVIVNYLAIAHTKRAIHALIEVDVTQPRQMIRAYRDQSGESLSFTAFIIFCLTRVVDEDKTLHAYRLGKKRLIVFDEVDITTHRLHPLSYGWRYR